MSAERKYGFEEWLRLVDKAFTRFVGVSLHDIADARWRDLYDSVGWDVTIGDVIDTASEFDDLLAEFVSHANFRADAHVFTDIARDRAKEWREENEFA